MNKPIQSVCKEIADTADQADPTGGSQDVEEEEDEDEISSESVKSIISGAEVLCIDSNFSLLLVLLVLL